MSKRKKKSIRRTSSKSVPKRKKRLLTATRRRKKRISARTRNKIITVVPTHREKQEQRINLGTFAARQRVWEFSPPIFIERETVDDLYKKVTHLLNRYFSRKALKGKKISAALYYHWVLFEGHNLTIRSFATRALNNPADRQLMINDLFGRLDERYDSTERRPTRYFDREDIAGIEVFALVAEVIKRKRVKRK